MRIVFVLCTLAVLALEDMAAGQDSLPDYYGDWAIMGPNVIYTEMSLRPTGSTWTAYPTRAQSLERPCLALTRPIAIVSHTQAEIKLIVEGQKIDGACPNLAVSLARINARLLSGMTNTGLRIKARPAERRLDRFQGSWLISGTNFIDSLLEVSGDNATWHVYASNLQAIGNPCYVRTKPVSVRYASESGLVFTVLGSDQLVGCPDSVGEFTFVDSTTLRGTYGGFNVQAKLR